MILEMDKTNVIRNKKSTKLLAERIVKSIYSRRFFLFLHCKLTIIGEYFFYTALYCTKKTMYVNDVRRKFMYCGSGALSGPE